MDLEKEKKAGFTKLRAHVLTQSEWERLGQGGAEGLKVRQEIRDMYKDGGYDGIDLYSPAEEILFRVHMRGVTK